ncbi:MAG TPA: hypothetical protein VEL03_01220 [Streptosporangiaceae bacterium]|nr:hypothetical protein [Streptosporangiaceae bacterium]
MAVYVALADAGRGRGPAAGSMLGHGIAARQRAEPGQQEYQPRRTCDRR